MKVFQFTAEKKQNLFFEPDRPHRFYGYSLSSPCSLNPLGERVPTACLFSGPRCFLGAPARTNPCTEPGRYFMSARATLDSRREGVNHVEKDRRLPRVDARPPPCQTYRPLH